ncbi:hypothetical protein [Rhodococcus erythropolis]|uniref:hypothetical protein n=1 Tax=Rhodococcus erythropolis TaxID=1833 RepID=UPI0004A874CB|nr:hypothetical protein [Rhodococcus erythropolis]
MEALLQLFSLTWIVLRAELIAQLGLSAGGGVVFVGSDIEVGAGRDDSSLVSGDRRVRVEQCLRGSVPSSGAVEACSHVRGAAGAGVLLAHLSAPPIGRVDEAAEHGSEVFGGDVD